MRGRRREFTILRPMKFLADDHYHYRDFFPGAFAYHWHGYWDAPEHQDSYFGLFRREIDRALEERLALPSRTGD